MIATLVAPGRVIPWLTARDARHVICQMADVASAEVHIDSRSLQRAILSRQGISVFGFGRGIAVPHAMIPQLERPLGVFARLRPAQDFGAADHLPVDLAFLLLSAERHQTAHLRALAGVVRRLRDREVAECLRQADGVDAIYAVLTSDMWQLRQSGGHAPALPLGT